MKSLRKKSNESGIVLLTVVIVSCVMMILVASALDFVKRASDQSYKSYYKQQAYLTAQTTLDAFVGQIDGNANKDTKDKLESLANSNAVIGVDLDDIVAGAGNNAYEFGDCNISLSKNSNVIAITATSTYPGEPSKNGQTQSVTAYVKIDSKNISQKLESALVTNGVNVPYHNNLNVRGGVTTQKFNPNAENTWSLICNSDTYEGKCNFNGAMSFGNNFTFKDDPNHIANGVVVTVTDFIFPGQNNMKVTSQINNAMTSTPNGSDYLTASGEYDDMNTAAVNYVNVYGALATGGAGAGHVEIGTVDHRADLYVSTIMFGSDGFLGNSCFGNIVNSMTAYPETPDKKGITPILNKFKSGTNQTGNIIVYGNLFCYNTNRTGVDYCDGNIYISNVTGGQIVVNGNAYVEGDIILADSVSNGRLQVNGDLVMSSTSKIKDTSGKILFDPSTDGSNLPSSLNAISVTGPVTTTSDIQGMSVRNARPNPDDDTGTTQKYKYTAEQLLLSQVDPGDKGVPYYKDVYSADHGVTYNYIEAPTEEIDVPCYEPDGSYTTKKVGFKHIQGQNVININEQYTNGSGWNGNILVEVDSSDVVILLGKGVSGMDASRPINIFVHNTSPEEDTDIDGEIIHGRKYNCYIVSDSYLGGGNWDTEFQVNFDKFMLVDYDIACHAGYFKNGQFTGGQIINNTDRSASDLASIPTNPNTVNSYYDLTSNSIIMVLSSGKDDSHISFKTQNTGMVNANIFAPNASFVINGANTSFKMANKVTGTGETVDHYGGLGQFIVHDLNNPDVATSNVTTLEMYRANPSSILSYVLHNSKSANDDYTAYKVIGYSYKSNGIS